MMQSKESVNDLNKQSKTEINESLLKDRYAIIKSRYRGNVQSYDDWRESEIQSNPTDYVLAEKGNNVVPKDGNVSLVGTGMNKNVTEKKVSVRKLAYKMPEPNNLNKKTLISGKNKNCSSSEVITNLHEECHGGTKKNGHVVGISGGANKENRSTRVSGGKDEKDKLWLPIDPPVISEKIHSLVNRQEDRLVDIVVDGIDGIYNKPSVLTVNVGDKLWRYNLINNIGHSTEKSYQQTIGRDKILYDITRHVGFCAPDTCVKYSLRAKNPNYVKEQRQMDNGDNKKYIGDMLTSNGPYDNVVWKLKRHVLPKDYVISNKVDRDEHSRFLELWRQPLDALKQAHRNTKDNLKRTDESVLVGLKYHADKSQWLSNWKKNVLASFDPHLKEMSSHEQLCSTLDNFVDISHPQNSSKIYNTTPNLAKIFDSKYSDVIHAKIGESIKKCNNHYELLNDINTLFGDKYQHYDYAMIGGIFDTLKRKLVSGVKNLTSSYRDARSDYNALVSKVAEMKKLWIKFEGLTKGSNATESKETISLGKKIKTLISSIEKLPGDFNEKWTKIKDDESTSTDKKGSTDSTTNRKKTLRNDFDTEYNKFKRIKSAFMDAEEKLNKGSVVVTSEEDTSSPAEIKAKISSKLEPYLNKKSMYRNMYEITPSTLIQNVKNQQSILGFELPKLVNIHDHFADIGGKMMNQQSKRMLSRNGDTNNNDDDDDGEKYHLPQLLEFNENDTFVGGKMMDSIQQDDQNYKNSQNLVSTGGSVNVIKEQKEQRVQNQNVPTNIGFKLPELIYINGTKASRIGEKVINSKDAQQEQYQQHEQQNIVSNNNNNKTYGNVHNPDNYSSFGSFGNNDQKSIPITEHLNSTLLVNKKSNSGSINSINMNDSNTNTTFANLNYPSSASHNSGGNNNNNNRQPSGFGFGVAIGDQFHLHNVDHDQEENNTATNFYETVGGNNENINVIGSKFEMAPLVDIDTLSDSNHIESSLIDSTIGDKYSSNHVDHYSTLITTNDYNIQQQQQQQHYNNVDPIREELVLINKQSTSSPFLSGIGNSMNNDNSVTQSLLDHNLINNNINSSTGFQSIPENQKEELNIGCHMDGTKLTTTTLEEPKEKEKTGEKKNKKDKKNKKKKNKSLSLEEDSGSEDMDSTLIGNKVGYICHIHKDDELEHFIDKHDSNKFYKFMSSNEIGEKYRQENNIIVIPNNSKFKVPKFEFQQQKALIKHFESTPQKNMDNFLQSLEPFKTEKGAFISNKFVKTFDDTLYNVANTIYNPTTQKLYLFVE